jgi:inhibitor of KinA sporulation pathway (predicted exonuclease)
VTELVTAEQFRRRPRGVVMGAGAAWIYGSPDGQLFYSIVFGLIDETSAAALLALWECELETSGHRSLCDARGLRQITPAAFARLTEFLTKLPALALA